MKKIKKKRTVRKKEVEGFGERLRKERENRMMTREQVAEGARISPGTLQKIEGGVVKNPSISTVMDIVNSLGIDKRTLVGILAAEVIVEEDKSVEFLTKEWKRWGSKK